MSHFVTRPFVILSGAAYGCVVEESSHKFCASQLQNAKILRLRFIPLRMTGIMFGYPFGIVMVKTI